jgi:hypothetical protein
VKIATFNVNGVNWRLPVLLHWLEQSTTLSSGGTTLYVVLHEKFLGRGGRHAKRGCLVGGTLKGTGSFQHAASGEAMEHQRSGRAPRRAVPQPPLRAPPPNFGPVVHSDE